MRQDSYEWWSGMRFAVGWDNIKKETAPQLQRKKIARFTQYVTNDKTKELLCGYINAQLQAGV